MTTRYTITITGNGRQNTDEDMMFTIISHELEFYLDKMNINIQKEDKEG